MCRTHNDCGPSGRESRCCNGAAPEGREACCHHAPESLDRQQRIQHYRHKIECLQGLLAEVEQSAEGEAT